MDYIVYNICALINNALYKALKHKYIILNHERNVILTQTAPHNRLYDTAATSLYSCLELANTVASVLSVF